MWQVYWNGYCERIMGTEDLTRRQALAAGVAGATLSALPKRRLPVVYLPHGGGPWPFVDLGMGNPAELGALRSYLEALPAVPKAQVKAVLIVSAHWEEALPTVMTSTKPPMLYDYYGFPPESYRITWPAPGHPELAAQVRQLLERAGFKTGADDARGYDHGTFVPLKVAFPNAEVPTVQLSLKSGLDPTEHLKIGHALASLRDEGVFIVGSGMSFHNLRAFNSPMTGPVSEAFDKWLTETASLAQADRDERLTQWAKAPSARQAHPREEHLMPLMVIAGAAGADRGVTAFSNTLMGARISAYHFG
jgi:aromatic ring-opening dioxygenase catalytic subunit (LigB family)